MNKMYKYLIFLVLVIVGGAVFYNNVYKPKITYKTVSISNGDMTKKVFGIGEISSRVIYSVSAGVNAKVTDVFVDEGDWVKKGQVLAILDSVELPTLLAQSKDVVTKTLKQLLSLKSDLTSLKAQENLAYVTYKRYKKLKKDSFVSQSEYDNVKTELDVLKAKIKSIKAQISLTKIEVEIAKKTTISLEDKLKNYTIYSPVDGLIVEKDGDISQALLSSQAIFKIVNKDDVWVDAYVDEKITKDIKVGDIATIKIRSNPDKVYSGYVKRVSPQSDGVTQERKINIAFKNLPIPFYINEQAEVEIETNSFKNVAQLPVSTIVYKNKRSGVWIKKESKAEFKEVKILAINDSKVAVDGLTNKDEIIVKTTKNRPLENGMRIY